MEKEFIRPAALRPGDRIAIVSPAGIVKAENVAAAADVLRCQGWDVSVSEHALGRSGTFSGTPTARLKDMTKALLDPEVKAVMCGRGGYGAVHLMEPLAKLPLRECAKWVIGFSDISAIHSLLRSRGIMSIHSSMTRRLAQTGGTDAESEMLFSLLRGEPMSHSFAAHPLNRPGRAEGRLTGGNLAVTAALMGTPFSPFTPDATGTILFIEDIGEPIYKVERMLMQLRLSGFLARLKGLVVGQFTNYTADANYSDMYDMIAAMVSDYDFPTLFGAPIGHIDGNIPLVYSSTAILDITSTGATLTEKNS